ncbi:MAG: hypothetical protein RLY14_165 [Planctomycetota bacterium]|jgi:hypothetical protein
MRENEGVVVVESKNSGMMMATMAPDILIERGFYKDHAALFDQLMSSVSWDDRMAARRTAFVWEAL